MCVGKQLLNVCCGDCFATPPLEGACSAPQDGCCGQFKNMPDNDRINRNFFRIIINFPDKYPFIRKVPVDPAFQESAVRAG